MNFYGNRGGKRSTVSFNLKPKTISDTTCIGHPYRFNLFFDVYFLPLSLLSPPLRAFWLMGSVVVDFIRL
jgi:hypothetical protein